MAKIVASHAEIKETTIEGVTKYTCGNIAIYKLLLVAGFTGQVAVFIPNSGRFQRNTHKVQAAVYPG